MNRSIPRTVFKTALIITAVIISISFISEAYYIMEDIAHDISKHIDFEEIRDFLYEIGFSVESAIIFIAISTIAGAVALFKGIKKYKPLRIAVIILLVIVSAMIRYLYL